MDSKSSFEKKDESLLDENISSQKPCNNIKRMIFHTETIQQSPLCLSCKRYKCECRKKNPDQKPDSDSLQISSNPLPCKITSKVDKEKKQNFLGNKRKTEEEKTFHFPPSQKYLNPVDLEQFTDLHNEENKVLDLNMLYNAVSPPSELNEEINDDKSSSNNKKIRKSTRIKKEKTHVFQIFYCHQCKKSDNTFNMLICTNPACRDAYCFHCLKKYYFKGENSIECLKNKIEEEKKDWICFMCKGKCTCKTCNKNSDVPDTSKDNEKPNDGKINKKTLGISVPYPEEEKKQNVVKIDEYVIYENEGPDDEDSDNSVNLDIDNDEDFTEKSKKNEKKSKFTCKNLKKNERIINFPMKNCLICSKEQSGTTEFLSFKSIEDFLNSLKRTYEINESGPHTEVEEYHTNRNAFFDYFKNFHKHYNSDYVFKSIKYFCKTCFNQNLVMKNGFDNLFTALHVSFIPNSSSGVYKKVDQSQKPIKIPIENKTSSKDINILFSTNNPPKTTQINYNNIVQIPSDSNLIHKNTSNDSVTTKLINDLTVKKETKDFKQIETCDRIELNPEIKLAERDNNLGNNNINKIIDIISNNKPNTNNFSSINSSNSVNNNNPLLKFLNIMNPGQQNANPNSNNNPIMNNPLLSQLNNPQSSLPSNPSSSMNNTPNVSSLVNLLQNMHPINSQIQPNMNNPNNPILQQYVGINNNGPNQNPLNTPNIGCNQQSQNLNHITNNIGKLVEIISQYNQKHLYQNASMLSNINNLVNTMTNIVPLDSKTTNTQTKNEVPPQESLKDNSGEKKDLRPDNCESTVNNDQNLNTNDEKKDLSGILQNFDSTKNNLSSYMFNVLDELKKQIYSIQYYSLVQKLFISYIFKNLDIFIEQLASNQALNNLNSNQIFKGVQTPCFNNFGENMSSLSDQLNLLKKIAENLAMNQMNNPLLNSSNLEELNSLLGSVNPCGPINSNINNPINPNNINFNNVNSLLNLPINNNPPNNSFGSIPPPINNVGSVNPIKNNLQNMNTIFNKEGKNTENNNNTNSLPNPNNLNNPINQIPNMTQNNNNNHFPSHMSGNNQYQSHNTNNNQYQQHNSNSNQYQPHNNNNNQYQPHSNNNNQYQPQNNNMIDQILKGMKIQPQSHAPNLMPSNPNHGQIIMPINIETASTNIIQNPANQMYSLNNNQQPQPMNNQNILGNMNGNNLPHNPFLFQLNNMMNPNGNPNGFSQSNLLSNPNLMNLLLQGNSNNNITSQYPNNNNSNQKY